MAGERSDLAHSAKGAATVSPAVGEAAGGAEQSSAGGAEVSVVSLRLRTESPAEEGGGEPAPPALPQDPAWVTALFEAHGMTVHKVLSFHKPPPGPSFALVTLPHEQALVAVRQLDRVTVRLPDGTETGAARCGDRPSRPRTGELSITLKAQPGQSPFKRPITSQPADLPPASLKPASCALASEGVDAARGFSRPRGRRMRGGGAATR